MAGIGFELRKLLKRDTLLGMLQAYAYAGIISSGPWILSIVGILIIGLASVTIVVPSFLITQFQVSVTYLIAASLILTGTLQLAFTRFTADRLFEKRNDIVLSNFNLVSLTVTLAAGIIGALAAVFLFPEQSILYRLMMLGGFVIISNIWIATIFLSGMKQYKEIVLLYFLGYSISVVAAMLLRHLNLEGLLIGFITGQIVLLVGMMVMILRNYPARRFISFEVFHKDKFYPSLAWIGLFYNLGVWIDKFMFWYFPATSQNVIGPLRASLIYDLPVFLAYMSIIPGMAIFLVRLETDFVEFYDSFYSAVREGGSLETIEKSRNAMVDTVRLGIYEIIKIQAIATLMLFVVGDNLLRWLGISELYLPLLYIDVIGASLQVVFLGVVNVFFYLDKRRIVLFLTGLFVVLNTIFTAITLYLGPAFYGYGFAIAMLCVVLLGFHLLNSKLDSLEYETFMLQ